MKRLLTILGILIILGMVKLNSQEIDSKIKDRMNTYIGTFQIQKITWQNQEGFFIPAAGYNQFVILLRDYIYYQDLLELKEARIKQLESLETMNFKLKTGLGISIAFDVGSLFLCAGLSLLCYNLAKK
jgi:hypothetical protein